MPASFDGDQVHDYDVVVVGSGLGGLSAAGFLGKAGRKVLLVEARDKFGGVAAQFERGPYKIDPAIHIMAVGENYLMWKALRYLEVFDQLEFVPTGGFFDARLPQVSLRVARGPGGVIHTPPGEGAGAGEDPPRL